MAKFNPGDIIIGNEKANMPYVATIEGTTWVVYGQRYPSDSDLIVVGDFTNPARYLTLQRAFNAEGRKGLYSTEYTSQHFVVDSKYFDFLHSLRVKDNREALGLLKT